MKTSFRGACVVVVSGVLALAAGPAAAGDPAVDLKSPDVALRLGAVESIRSGPVANAEALLVAALADTDWEVVEKAADAIGHKGADGGAGALVKVAMEHPARRVRVTAAQALAKLGTWEGVADDFGKVRPSELALSLDAVAEIAATRDSAVLVKLVDRGLAAKKDPPARAAAARGIGAYAAADRPARLRELSADDDVAVAAGAVDGIRAKRDDACAPVFLEIVARPKVPETLARRARAAFVEAVGRKAKGDEAAKLATTAADALKAAATPEAAWQLARLLGEIGELKDEHVPRAVLFEGLSTAFARPSPKPRAAGAWSLGRIGGDEAADRATELAKSDTDAHVRLTALQSVARLRNATHDGTIRLFADRLGDDADILVRTEAAVALGHRGVSGAVPALTKAVERALDEKSGSEWTVGTAALVSMGKTRSADGVPFLIETAAKAKDWKLRASALVGLGHVQDKTAIPALIDALGAKESIQRNVAFEFLRRIHPEIQEAKQSEWAAWWKKSGADFRFVDREEEARKARKYGYAPDLTGVYEGLDVVVLQSEDRIELLLEELKVGHRITRSGQVPDAGLHPFALLFSNCTGKITPKDVEPIAWFVHNGGYLFGSCWALKETIEKVCPGVIRKFPLPGQVLQNPVAEPCLPGSPFVADVFRPLVQPVYILWGSYLIDVLDPERAEVLMDSPSTEEKFGNGNLVAWFTAGHGVVLDSTNHFELQGYGRVDGIEKPEEIMAYALDHLGLTYAELRKVPPGAWKSKNEANKEVKDLSCFRFITNFVREKRKSQE